MLPETMENIQSSDISRGEIKRVETIEGTTIVRLGSNDEVPRKPIPFLSCPECLVKVRHIHRKLELVEDFQIPILNCPNCAAEVRHKNGRLEIVSR